MVRDVLSVILCAVFMLLFYFVGYSVFYVEFSDDIDVKHGKRTLKRYYKKHKVSMLRKFIFGDFRKSISRLNYVLFWGNMLSMIVLIVGMAIEILYSHDLGNKICLYAVIAYLLTLFIPQLSARSIYLHAGNQVKRRYWRKRRKL